MRATDRPILPTKKFIRRINHSFLALTLAVAGCSGAWPHADQPGSANPAITTIDCGHPQQQIDGFGFATAWANVPRNPKSIEALFSTTQGAGLSIVRNRIPFNENPIGGDNFLVKKNGAYLFTTVSDDEGTYKNFKLRWDNYDLTATRTLVAALKSHHDYPLPQLFSTPWTPPNNSVDRWKHPTDAKSAATNRLTNATYATKPAVGGYLDPRHYQDYADLLADYVLGFKDNMGCDLYALSLQNEPGFDCDYESCDWTAAQLHDFLRVLDKEFARKGVRASCPQLKIIAPESNDFHERLLHDIYADRATRNIVQIAAFHEYDYGPWCLENALANLFTDHDTFRPNTFEQSRAYQKRIWMTEWNMSAFHEASDIQQALLLARLIHLDFTQSHLNAFVFWWTSSLIPNKGSTADQPTKILEALAQYSRFAQPGWHVLAATPSSTPGVYVTAFADNTGKIEIVVVNTQPTAQIVNLHLSHASPIGTINFYRTSEHEDMASLEPIVVNSTDKTLTFAPLSITTCVGDLVR